MRTDSTKKYIARRGWATFLDYTFIMIVTYSYFYLAGEPNAQGVHELNGLPALVPMLFWFLYIVVAEYYLGGTPGHIVLKLKVTSMNNDKVSFGRTVLRRVVDVIEITWCFGFIAWLIAKNTPFHQRLGDLIAKTCVVGVNDEDIEMSFDFDKEGQAV